MTESIPWLKTREENISRTQSLITHLIKNMQEEDFKLLEIHECFALMLVSLDGACCMIKIRENDVWASYKLEDARILENLIQNIETWEAETKVVSEIRLF